MSKQVVIVGGGVIGLSNAYALIKAGASVTLVESDSEVAMGASFANGGQLSYRYVSPLADAGVPLQGLKWMGKEDSPLNFKLRASFKQWSWLLQFTAACTRRTNQVNGAHILRLSLLSQDMLNQWRTSGDIGDFHWRRSGKMIIHRDQASFEKASQSVDPEFQQVLNNRELCDLEPALIHIQDQLRGAIYAPADETADCHAFCVQLLAYLKQQPQFRLLTERQVTGFATAGERILGLETTSGRIEADEFIVAAGNGSVPLLAKLGIKVAVYPLKGYSLTLPFPEAAHVVPSISVTDYGHKIVYAKLGDELRVAAMVDIGYEDQGLRANRVAALKRTVRASFPKLGALDEATAWSGLRPSTPKGPPILGRTKYTNLWLNIGHGSLGFTLAAGSATVLTHLVTGAEAPISLTGLTG